MTTSKLFGHVATFFFAGTEILLRWSPRCSLFDESKLNLDKFWKKYLYDGPLVDRIFGMRSRIEPRFFFNEKYSAVLSFPSFIDLALRAGR